MKRNIRNTKKTGKRKLILAACLFSMAYVLSSCGKGNENSEEQTSAYVYVAQQLANLVLGRIQPAGRISEPDCGRRTDLLYA